MRYLEKFSACYLLHVKFKYGKCLCVYNLKMVFNNTSSKTVYEKLALDVNRRI